VRCKIDFDTSSKLVPFQHPSHTLILVGLVVQSIGMAKIIHVREEDKMILKRAKHIAIVEWPYRLAFSALAMSRRI